MTTFDRMPSPAETIGAHAVSKEDVGHGVGTSSRNDGYARRTRSKVSKAKHERNTRKSNSGEVTGEADSAEDEANDDEEQADAQDEDATEDDDPDLIAPSGGLAKVLTDSSLVLPSEGSDETAKPQAGLFSETGKGLKRKRTTSELSASTVLSTIEHDDEQEYPRKRASRRLSNEHGLLKYEAAPIDIDEDMDVDDEIDVEAYAKAIESSSEDEAEDEDGGYDGISQVDDEDDSDVEKLEEAMIIEEETALLDPELADAGDSDLDLPSDVDFTPFLNSEMDEIFSAGESFFFQGFESDPDIGGRKKSDASTRRVRFQDEIDVAQVYSSSGTSSDTDIDIFPDLLDNPFKSQDDLPAHVKSQLEKDDDGDVAHLASSDGEGSVWDFGEEKASENFFSWHDEAGSESDEETSSSLSGYDSDGDTTDDDLPPPTTIRAPKSLLHRHTPSTMTSEPPTPKAFPRSRRAARRGPIMGSFIVDERKAFAFIDPNTKQLRIQPAKVAPFGDPFNSTASSANNSPHVNFNSLPYDSDNSDFTRLLTGPSDVMMSGVFGGLPGQRYEDGRFVMEANGPLLIGPPEAFYPFTSIGADGTPDSNEDDYISEEFEDDVDLITAFIDIEGDDEEIEFDEEDITSPTTTDAIESTPSRAQSLLSHLDRRGVVTSFRSNQDRYRHASQFAHSHNLDSTPVRNGRTAEEVITPSRKRKSSSMSQGKVPGRMPLMGGFT